MKDFDDEKENKQLDELHKQEEEELVAMLAESKYGLPYIDLHRIGVDNEALRIIPEKEAIEMKVAPFKLFGKKISMAESSQVGGLDISAEVLRNTAKSIHHIQDIEKLTAEALKGNKIHKISRLLEVILAGAIAIKASDVHIEPEKDRGRLRLRLDGILQDISFFDLSVYRLLNSRIKLISQLKLTSSITQDGRFNITEGDEEISIRTSLIPGSYGESIVFRILHPKSIQVEMEKLGIEPYLFEVVNKEIVKPNGLILVTGPTGSGKTTTLYAFLRKIYSKEINIITIEDPVTRI